MWPEGQLWKPGPAYPATVAAPNVSPNDCLSGSIPLCLHVDLCPILCLEEVSHTSSGCDPRKTFPGPEEESRGGYWGDDWLWAGGVMPKGVDAECRGEEETEPEATGVGGCWRGGPVACQALHDEDAD